jgi:hypothetical protein
MADDPHNTSDISDHVEIENTKEDAETTAARRELKQTSISEKTGKDAQQLSQDDKSGSDDDKPKDKAPSRGTTPETDVGESKSDDLRNQVSSPKKKRGHDELEEHKDSADEAEDTESSTKAAKASPTLSRIDGSEPEKKRARDGGQVVEPTRSTRTRTVKIQPRTPP